MPFLSQSLPVQTPLSRPLSTNHMTGFLVDDIFVNFGWCLYRQFIRIPIATNCPPLFADMFLSAYEHELLDGLVRSSQRRLLGH